MARDSKITPITRHDPRTFYATRTTRAKGGEVWDLWSVQDGRRVGFLSVVDDDNVVYAQVAVRAGTSTDEVVDLLDGLFPPSATEASTREIIISEYQNEPTLVESDFEEIS